MSSYQSYRCSNISTSSFKDFSPPTDVAGGKPRTGSLFPTSWSWSGHHRLLFTWLQHLGANSANNAAAVEHTHGIGLHRSLVSMPPTVACWRRCRAGVPHQAHRSPPPDVCDGPVRRSCPRRFRRIRRGRGPRVTWAGMARSPRRLPRRPADSPALPLQHTQRDSRPLMFRHDQLWSLFGTRARAFKSAFFVSSCCYCCENDGDPRHPEPKFRSAFFSAFGRGLWGGGGAEERPKERSRFTAEKITSLFLSSVYFVPIT